MVPVRPAVFDSGAAARIRGGDYPTAAPGGEGAVCVSAGVGSAHADYEPVFAAQFEYLDVVDFLLFLPVCLPLLPPSSRALSDLSLPASSPSLSAHISGSKSCQRWKTSSTAPTCPTSFPRTSTSSLTCSLGFHTASSTTPVQPSAVLQCSSGPHQAPCRSLPVHSDS